MAEPAGFLNRFNVTTTSQSEPVYWCNGQLLPKSNAAVSVSDLAFTRGYTAFEAMRTYNRVPFLLDAHLSRLGETCTQLGISAPAGLAQAVAAAIAANPFPECLVRVYVTGGEAPGFVPAGKEGAFVLVDPLRELPEAQYRIGVALATSPFGRSLPSVKSTNYVVGVRETLRAKARGFDEIVYLDRNGAILEGTTFNVVAVRGRTLVTPQEGVLAGITLRHALRLIEGMGLIVRWAPISRDDVTSADEMFITSSTREIMPVSVVDGHKIGSGPGPITLTLLDRFRASAAEYATEFRRRR